MKLISLFSGIGGFELAAEWMGWQVLSSCEINPFGQKVLEYYWPGAYHHQDIHTLNYELLNEQLTTRFGEEWNEADDIVLVGGFPCQPYSTAGKRLGKEDERHLWPEMLRVIREVQPRYVVGENVRGLTNWNGGMVFDEVQADLEAEGYEVLPFLLPACGVNAPHRRDRIWFIAHAERAGAGRLDGAAHNKGRRTREDWGEGLRQTHRPACAGRFDSADTNGFAPYAGSDGHELREFGENKSAESAGVGIEKERERLRDDNRGIGEQEYAADTNNSGLQRVCKHREHREHREQAKKSFDEQFARCILPTWGNFPTQPPLRFRNDVFSRELHRYISKEYAARIKKSREANGIKNLPEVWQRVQSPEVWESLRRSYSLESKEILFQTMQLFTTGWEFKGELSCFSEEASKEPLRILQKHGEFRCTSRGRELEKQLTGEPSNIMSYLPHEVALAAKENEKMLVKFDSWWRAESVKAAGNAVVPKLVYQIFKAINDLQASQSMQEIK